MGTLSLGKKPKEVVEADPLELPPEEKGKPEGIPEFDPSAHYGEVGGILGVKYVQGAHFYRPDGSFHSVAPPEARMKPLTKEQEADRQRRLGVQRKAFGNKLAQAAGNVPESIVKAERENARAKAAESLAE